jgi:release factor glutamine methyltransferase
VTTTEPKTWTIEAVVRWATDDFRARGIENPRLDAEVLCSFALGISRIQLIVDGKRPLVPTELARLRDLVRRRRTHEPIAYLRGEREFYGRVFHVDKRVLVPRPDTEALVDVALARTSGVSMAMRALDLCTGSGCVAITLARQRPTAFVVGTDLSAEALAVARDNACRLGAYNVAFAQGDLFDFDLGPAFARRSAAARRFDVVTANPPYIPSAEIAGLMADVRDFEPRGALDGGADGLDFVRRIVAGARAVLVPGGALAVEVGAGQAEEVSALFAAAGYVDVTTARDIARIERVVHGELPAR